ncbi:MAG TPA: hypothetical protein VFA33_19350 [Bryobacteraceae bacterium]|nr:hypothetical protein [Bryobacteraceae bacterium]
MRLGLSILMALCSVAMFADTPADRAKLPGTWQREDGSGKGTNSVWVLEAKGDAFHITHSEAGQKVSEYECNTMGRECKLKDAGKQAKVSMWFNGSKLVEIETRGSDVVKRRFGVGTDDTLEVEVIPIVPNGKPEVEHYKRAPLAAASH